MTELGFAAFYQYLFPEDKPGVFIRVWLLQQQEQRNPIFQVYGTC